MTGARRWTLSLPGASDLISGATSQNSPPVPGIVTDSSGQELIIAAYAVTIPGSGIQASEEQTKVIAADTAGRVQWDKATPASLALAVSFVGSLSDSLGPAFVLNAGETIVMDADSGSVRWTANNVIPDGVVSDKVIGEQMGSDEWTWMTVALASADGSQIWVGLTYTNDVEFEPSWLITARPERLVVPSADGGTRLIDTATGKIVTNLAEQTNTGIDIGNQCLFDGEETVVCWQLAASDSPAGVAFGFDARTGQKLWEIPANAEQTNIDVTCAYDGRVYANANGAVVLNARNGARNDRAVITD